MKGRTRSGATAATADAGACALTLARPRTAVVPALRAALARGAQSSAGCRHLPVAIPTTGVAILRHPLVAIRTPAGGIPLRPHAATRTTGAVIHLRPLVVLGLLKALAVTPTVMRPLALLSRDMMAAMARLTADAALRPTATRAPSTLSMKATGVIAAAAANVDHRLLAAIPSTGRCLTP